MLIDVAVASLDGGRAVVSVEIVLPRWLVGKVAALLILTGARLQSIDARSIARGAS